jgi:hypothetical protein
VPCVVAPWGPAPAPVPRLARWGGRWLPGSSVQPVHTPAADARAGRRGNSPEIPTGCRGSADRQGPCKTPVRACPGRSLSPPLAAHCHAPIVHGCRRLYTCSCATHLVHLHRSFYAIEAPVIYLGYETTTLYPTLD